jgi:hypothetical protein
MKAADSGARVQNLIFIMLCLMSVVWCIYRDIHLEKIYTGDLRNRIVGSRMQMDGKSPYFYHYQDDQNIRYYDWNNGTVSYRISNVTATPFLHQLLSPIANFSQYTISKIWFAVEYLTLLLMTLMAAKLAKTRRQKTFVFLMAVVYLHSNAWTNHMSVGQMYILIPAQALLLYYLLNLPQKNIHALLAGVVAAAVVLTRPTTIVFLLTLLLLVGQYRKQYLIYLAASFIITLALAFGTGKSMFYWQEYRQAMTEQLNAHRGVNPNPEYRDSLPDLQYVEGWSKPEMHKAEEFRWYRHNDANGNVFVFLDNVFKIKTPVWVLGVLCLLFMLTLVLLFFKYTSLPWTRFAQPVQGVAADLFPVSLLGFILYMSTDLFSPIYRFHYNAIQWIFPLLIVAGRWSPGSGKLPTAIALLGLILHSVPWVGFPMQQCVGEYLIMLSLIIYLLTYKKNVTAL